MFSCPRLLAKAVLCQVSYVPGYRALTTVVTRWTRLPQPNRRSARPTAVGIRAGPGLRPRVRTRLTGVLTRLAPWRYLAGLAFPCRELLFEPLHDLEHLLGWHADTGDDLGRHLGDGAAVGPLGLTRRPLEDGEVQHEGVLGVPDGDEVGVVARFSVRGDLQIPLATISHTGQPTP